MRWALRGLAALCGLVALGVSGLIIWFVVINPEPLRMATAYTAEIVCSNVFIAHRDVEAIRRDDLVALGHRIYKRMKIDVAQGSVTATAYGLFAAQQAQYDAGRGCTLVPDRETLAGPGEPPPAPPPSDVLWPSGEGAQLSDNPRLIAAINDPNLQGPGLRAIVVVHDGRIVAETYGQGFTAATPLLGWSMTKTVTAALVGLAIADGKLALDRTHLFPQWEQDGRARISVANLLAMSSGLEWSEDEGDVTQPGRMENLVSDAAAFARDRTLVAEPGAKFNYDGGDVVLLTRLWQDAVGGASWTYPRERLFAPLGMTSAVLQADLAGTFFGEGFLYANAHDWARYGEFLRLGGKWNGKQILPDDFVAYMRSPSPNSDEGHGPVYSRGLIWLGQGQGYGLPPDTFMMEGHNRQVIAIIPSRKMVILRMGSTREDIGYSTAPLLRAIVAAGQ
jgi:CubicO group peptidase (beta-lactamase class C family)